MNQPHSSWYPLFEHMSQQHGLTLTEDEMNEIAHMADKSRMGMNGGVNWILINALYHLNQDELKRLHEQIGSRI